MWSNVPIYHENHRIPAGCEISVLAAAGNVRYSPTASLSDHAHSSFQVTLICEGPCYFKCNDKKEELGKGSLCIAKPGEFHELSGNGKDEWDFMYLAVNSFIPVEIDRVFWCTNLSLLKDCDDLIPHFSRLLEEIRKKKSAAIEKTRAFLEDLFMDLARRITDKENSSLDRLCSKSLIAARKYIDANASHSLSKSDAAKSAGVAESKLRNQFAEEMETTAGKYMKIILMRKAEEMLRKGNTVSSVAKQLGFPSVQYFSASFKKFFGVRPSRFQRDTRLRFMCPASW